MQKADEGKNPLVWLAMWASDNPMVAVIIVVTLLLAISIWVFQGCGDTWYTNGAGWSLVILAVVVGVSFVIYRRLHPASKAPAPLTTLAAPAAPLVKPNFPAAPSLAAPLAPRPGPPPFAATGATGAVAAVAAATDKQAAAPTSPSTPAAESFTVIRGQMKPVVPAAGGPRAIETQN